MGATFSTVPQAPKLCSDNRIARPDELSFQQAWRSAMAWQDELREHLSVSLVIDQADPFDSLVESYAWVRFELPYVKYEGSRKEVDEATASASIARAAAITWHALSRCSGYDGSSNSTFWKRVFSGLQPVKIRPANSSVQDSVDFFSRRGHDFPRFVLALQGRVFQDQIEAVVGTFCGRPGFPAQLEIQSKLSRVLAQLESHSGRSRDRLSSLALSVSLPPSVFTSMGSAIPLFYDTRADCSEEPIAFAPNFKLQQVRASGLIKLDDDIDTQRFVDCLNRSQIQIGPLRIASNLGDTTHTEFARALHTILRTGVPIVGPPLKTTSLTFQHNRLIDTAFHGLCSSLPHATSVHSLSISVTQEARLFATRDMPWLAFALFHPNAKISSLRHLELRDLTADAEVDDVLTAMSVGNNLMQLLSGNPPTSDAYYRGFVASEAGIHMQPDQHAEKMLIGPDNEAIEVDVCGISSTDRATWGVWVAVVVPGYGLGWVLRSALYAVRGYAPSTPQLTGLRLISPTHCLPSAPITSCQAPESLLQFVKVFGSNLAHLDIKNCGEVEAPKIQDLLSACPRLERLAVEHSGDLGKTPQYWQQLKELSLRLPRGNLEAAIPPPTTSLHRLTALRFDLANAKDFDRTRKTVAQLLGISPSLRHLHWHHEIQTSSLESSPVRRSYEQMRRESHHRVRQLRVGHDFGLSAQGPFSASCALAMLSVVFSKQDDDTPLGELSSDLLRHIFQFATSPAHRRICIDVR